MCAAIRQLLSTSTRLNYSRYCTFHTELIAERDQAREELANKADMVSRLEAELLQLRRVYAAAEVTQPILGKSLTDVFGFQNLKLKPTTTPQQHQQHQEHWQSSPLQQQSKSPASAAHPLQIQVPAPSLEYAQSGKWQPSTHSHARSASNLSAGVVGSDGVTRGVPSAILRAADQPFVTPRIAVPLLGSSDFQRGLPDAAVFGLLNPQALAWPSVPSHQSAVMRHDIPPPPRRFLFGLFGCFGRPGMVRPV